MGAYTEYTYINRVGENLHYYRVLGSNQSINSLNPIPDFNQSDSVEEIAARFGAPFQTVPNFVALDRVWWKSGVGAKPLGSIVWSDPVNSATA